MHNEACSGLNKGHRPAAAAGAGAGAAAESGPQSRPASRLPPAPQKILPLCSWGKCCLCVSLPVGWVVAKGGQGAAEGECTRIRSERERERAREPKGIRIKGDKDGRN